MSFRGHRYAPRNKGAINCNHSNEFDKINFDRSDNRHLFWSEYIHDRHFIERVAG